ncbi:hypothetical protein EV666_11377 [Camelimonas lactis]|uniref:Uncharacterized protein n=1 Tax=Camelimonas lactis TaxID=659006 RepID=A0A4R2GPG9_9HYPH|nr:hypothetical protein EV666_11377 [Camelimonas lactis]
MPAQHDSLPIGAPAATPGAASQAIPDAGARAPHARGRPGGVCAFRARYVSVFASRPEKARPFARPASGTDAGHDDMSD